MQGQSQVQQVQGLGLQVPRPWVSSPRPQILALTLALNGCYLCVRHRWFLKRFLKQYVLYKFTFYLLTFLVKCRNVDA